MGVGIERAAGSERRRAWGAQRLLALCLLICAAGALVAFVTGATAATGLTRYVSSSGDDTANDCTDPSNPCAHVQYAVNQADPGDTVAVAGTVDDNVTVRISLTIAQWPGQATAVLDGGDNDIVVTVDGTNALVPPVVTLSGLTIQNGATFGDGGGITNNATLTVSNSTISSNVASGPLASGGGIANAAGGTLTVENSTISGNLATLGGGIDNRGMLDVENSTFSSNSASDGGGIFDEPGGTLTVANSTFSGNTGEGGAILESGTGTVVRSTITGNSANHNGAGINLQPGATLLVAESTFTGNSADEGGALWSKGALTVESSTITGNSAIDGAAIAILTGDDTTLAGDILAEQQGSNCGSLAGSFTDDGYNLDDDGSCISSASPGEGSHNGTTADGSSTYGAVLDAYLSDSLADNGGPTQTVALLNSPSPATTEADPALGVVPPSFDLPVPVDGESAACSVPDQRGVTPAAGIGCDIGAYLLQPTTTGLATSSASVLAGAPVTYTATVTPSPEGGTVAFSDGAGNPATVNCAARPLTGNQATCTVSYPAAGVFSVTATYSGDGTSNNDAASTSSPLLETVRTVPGAPTGISASAADEQATVSFAAPASNGGDAITGYTVTASPGGQTSSGGSSPITVTGLTDGTTYTFTVTATNSVGTGLQSAASNAVTPRDTHAPTAPAALTGRIAHNSLLLSWRASLDNLGVDHYEIYRNSSPILRVPGTAIVASLRSFQPRVASVFDVRAFDAAGNQSARSGSVTVTRVPRPKSAPKRIPRWAWQLLAWQKHHTGPKPATPKPLPHWYGAWKTWRNGLFRLLG